MDGASLLRLAAAMNYWNGRGYQSVTVPWIVPPRAAKVTFPTYRASLGDALVGSGEQSFIAMMLSGDLERREREIVRAHPDHVGRWVTCTPCFRQDPVDHFHQTEFMKVEVIDTAGNDPVSMARNAYYFFQRCVREADNVDYGRDLDIALVETDEGYDINLNGIEIGSYGSREYQGHRWVYGTGLAEPRFARAMDHIRRD